MPTLSPRHAALGDAIRARRKAQSLSQEDAAYRCGLDRAYFGSIERGERNVAVANLWRICDGLSIKASDLFAAVEEFA